jgi:hypothetical protein
MNNYSTLTEAVTDLKKRGYTIDFNLGFNGVQCQKSGISLAHDKFEITEVYRFEGDTNPDDEAIVYAIESRDGHKGILVNGYGVSSDPLSEEMVNKISISRHQDWALKSDTQKA